MFDPNAFIGKDWNAWRGPRDGNGLEGDEEQDAQASALAEFDVAALRFETSLADGESSISGKEKFKRLIALQLPLPGAKQFLALWLDYQDHLKQGTPEKSALEWLRQYRKIAYLDFFGTILRVPGGNRCVLCLYWGGGRWFWSFNWLDFSWSAHGFSAVLASQDSAL